MKECCGTCKWHIKDEDFDDDYYCCNGDSQYCSDWTDYLHYCYEYDERGTE